MKSQPQSSMSLGSVDDFTPSLDKMSKATSDSSTATLSLNSSSSTFSSCEEDDLLKAEKASFVPSEQGAKKSNQVVADPSNTPLQSPRRSLHMISPRKTPRRRASACDSVAMSHSSLSTARTNNTSASTRRQASRNANVKNQCSAAMRIASLPLVADFTDQRDMIRPQSDPRSLRRRHSMESAIPERRSSGTGIAPVVSPRKVSHLTNTPGTQKKRALNRRRERHDQVLSKGLTMAPQLWDGKDQPTTPHRAPRRGSYSMVQSSNGMGSCELENLKRECPARPDFARTSSIAQLDLIAQRSKLKQIEFPPSSSPQRSSSTPIKTANQNFRHTRNPRLSSPRRRSSAIASQPTSQPAQIGDLKMPDLVPVENANLSQQPSKQPPANPRKKAHPPVKDRADVKPVSEQEVYLFLANINKTKKAQANHDGDLV